jgi:hypothetical protein
VTLRLSIYELDDLAEEVRKRTGGDPLGMLTYANRMGNLEEMLDAIGLRDLLPGNECFSPRKIVVLGASEVNVRKLLSVAKDNGIDEDDIEFCLEYDRLKHYNFGRFRDKDRYRAVLFGPGPHSTPGKGQSCSAIEEMEAHQDIYPPIIRMEASGGLKITVKSFKQAILEVAHQ